MGFLSSITNAVSTAINSIKSGTSTSSTSSSSITTKSGGLNYTDSVIADYGKKYNDATTKSDRDYWHSKAEDYRMSLPGSDYYKGSVDGSGYYGPLVESGDRGAGSSSKKKKKKKPQPPAPPGAPTPPEKQEQIQVNKYEYVYGLQNLEVNSKEFSKDSIYVSKPIKIDGNVVQVTLSANEEHPLVTPRQTSIEYYISHTNNPTINDWIPILPEEDSIVKNELLFINGSTAQLRFPLNPNEQKKVYKNGQEYKGWSLGKTLQEIQINNPTAGAIYTINYTPYANIINPYVVDFNNSGAKPAKVTQEFDGTNRNGVIQLDYYPYIDYSKVNTTGNYDPNISYVPIAVTIGDANIIGKNGEVLTEVKPYSPTEEIYTMNITDYKTRKNKLLTPYDPTSDGNGGLVNPAIEYSHRGKYLMFTETFNKTDVEENMDINHGNGTIKVEYETLVTNVRIKIIFRCTSQILTTTPVLHGYTLKFRATK